MTSLRQLIERPELKASFSDHATGWAAWAATVGPCVEPAQDPALATEALEYLIQWELGRWGQDASVPIAQSGWLAQIGLHNLARRDVTRAHAPLWEEWMKDAQRQVAQHVHGPVVMPFRARATIAWRLAHLNALCGVSLRPSASFAHLPTPDPMQLHQLSVWLRRWQKGWQTEPMPRRRVWIHPDLALGGRVQHAGEVSLVMDGTLLSLRALADGLSPTWVRHLAGQAAWARIAGMHGVKGRLMLTDLAVCLVRQPEGSRWKKIALAELFPGEGWDAYCKDLAKAARI